MLFTRTDFSFYLFVASLLATTWVGVGPALLALTLFICLYAEERFVKFQESKNLSELQIELEKLRREVNALNLRAGLGR